MVVDEGVGPNLLLDDLRNLHLGVLRHASLQPAEEGERVALALLPSRLASLIHCHICQGLQAHARTSTVHYTGIVAVLSEMLCMAAACICTRESCCSYYTWTKAAMQRMCSGSFPVSVKFAWHALPCMYCMTVHRTRIYMMSSCALAMDTGYSASTWPGCH